jgi:hypothetical protein
MAFKSRVFSGTPENHIKYPNGNQGFNKKINTLGNDTWPGPAKGAPLSNVKQQMIDTTKRYWAGNQSTPGLLNDLPKVGGGIGFDELTPKSETTDSPVMKQGREMPNPRVTTKADEARIAEAKIGNEPSGVLDR